MLSEVLKVGTRGSPLALIQAREAGDRIRAAQGWAPDAIDIVSIRTTGDAIQDRALAEAGGKGLFTKELDVALADGAIDVAVHSAKDLPTVMPDGISIVGYLLREDVRDALITRDAMTLEALPAGAHIGSASVRRQAQLRRARPDLRVSLLRGNVQTRLAKVESGSFDATLLALAGLKRLGLAHVAATVLDIEDFLPAVGQGAIALAMRTGDPMLAAVSSVLDRDTGTALTCERAFLALLDGSCRTPIAGHARLHDGHLDFSGLVLSPDGTQAVETFAAGPSADAERVGQEAARDLLSRAPAGLFAPFQAM